MIQLGDFPMTKGSHQHPFRHKSLRGNGKPPWNPWVDHVQYQRLPLPFQKPWEVKIRSYHTASPIIGTPVEMRHQQTGWSLLYVWYLVTQPSQIQVHLHWICVLYIYIYLNPTACRVNFQIWMKHRRVKANHAWLLVGKSVNHEIPSLTHIFVGLCWINLG